MNQTAEFQRQDATPSGNKEARTQSEWLTLREAVEFGGLGQSSYLKYRQT